MARVAALYRYPVKGFAPEPCDALAVLAEGRIAGDRVLGFRFANSAVAGDGWSTKHEFVALVNTPGVARLEFRYDPETRRLRVATGRSVLADETLGAEGRTRIAEAVQRFVLELGENPLSSFPARLPLRLVGDGSTPRYQDSEAGQVTLHGRASLAAVAAQAGDPALSEVRFRSNIAVDGLRPWEEQAWIGRRLRIGDVSFRVVRPKTRCLATHANPQTGERDLPVLQVLRSIYPADAPTFAVAMTTEGPGGTIRVGDEVLLHED
ncbi:MAG: MOSC domain-containing protein [Betaproteobacteria bacterium]|nr:MOSC domain-containing protein [Betaproteobacteria bacterium]